MSPKGNRRQKGDGGLHFKHARTCPKPDPDTGERPKHKCTGSWVARVDLGRDGRGRRVSKEVSSREYATAVKKLREVRRLKEEHGTVPRGRLTVEKWLTTWLDTIVDVHERPSTAKSYRSLVTQQIVPTIGQRQLDKLTVEDVHAMHATLRKQPSRRGGTLSEATILKAHNVLSAALNAAWRQGKVMRNVCAIAEKPKNPEGDGVTLSVEEVRGFLRANSAHPLFPRWAVALFTGERQGEVLGMEWDRVDLEQGLAEVSWQLQRVGFRHGCGGRCGKKRAGSCPQRELDVPPAFTVRQLDGGLCLTRPKTNKGIRVVPLQPFLVAVLAQHKAGQVVNPHGLVFTRDDGRPLDPRTDLQDWRDALERAGLNAHGTHLARRVVTQHLRASGTDRDVMKDLLGHTSTAVTSIYLTKDAELSRAAMDTLGNAFAIEPAQD